MFRQTHAFSDCCGRKNYPHNVKAQRTPTEGFFNRAWRRKSPNHATTLVSFLQAAIYDIIIHNTYTNRHVYIYTYIIYIYTYTIYHIYIYHVSYIYTVHYIYYIFKIFFWYDFPLMDGTIYPRLPIFLAPSYANSENLPISWIHRTPDLSLWTHCFPNLFPCVWHVTHLWIDWLRWEDLSARFGNCLAPCRCLVLFLKCYGAWMS